MRYKVVKGSKSLHCCFKATVIDTHKPDYYVCECYEVSDAERIAEALNNEERCETCDGDGVTLIPVLYPTGHTEVNGECPDCGGLGGLGFVKEEE